MKILLIWPPMTVHLPDPKIPSVAVPLGLAYIAAVLEENGYDVKILDALGLGYRNIRKDKKIIRRGLNNTQIKKYIEKFNPDLVGISSMFSAYVYDVHNCAKIVKEIDSNIPVVVGGANASINPDNLLKDRNIDIVVKGEGEITFLELVKKNKNGKEFYKTLGTIAKKREKIIHNPERPYIKNLDSLPFPSRHLLPMDVYMEHIKAHGTYIMRKPHLNLISSRGCPGNCVFCSIHSVWGHTWRGRSAKNVVDEIEYLVNEYGAREIAFLDDNLTLDIKRAFKICDEIIQRKLDIKWCTPNGVALWALNKKLIKRMKESGCYRLTFGIESGCLETQKFIGKILPLDRVKSLIKFANRIGLWTAATFIIGFPYENKDSINKTIKYAIDCDCDLSVFYILAPFPGTRVYDVFEKEGLLRNIENWGYVLGGGGVDTKFFTREELKKLQIKAHSLFLRSRVHNFLNPIRIMRKSRSLEDFKYIMKIMRNFSGMIKLKKRSKDFDVKSWLRPSLKKL